VLARLKMLPKKTGPRPEAAFRPLTILPQIFKVYVGAAFRMMRHDVERQVPDWFLGRGSSLGADDAMTMVVAALQRRHEYGAPTVVFKMDVARAFDAVPRRHLLQEMRYFGVPEILARWVIASLAFTDYHLQHPFFHSASVIQATNGVAQGRADGPLLYRIAICRLMMQLKTRFDSCGWGWPTAVEGSLFNALLYVDDLMLFACSMLDVQCMANWAERVLRGHGWSVALDKCDLLASAGCHARWLRLADQRVHARAVDAPWKCWASS
jgi:hypothetical protein